MVQILWLIESLGQLAKAGRMYWYGHVLRSRGGNILRRALEDQGG